MIDGFMRDLLGVSDDDYERSLSTRTQLPMAMFNSLLALIDRSGVVEQIASWENDTRKSAAGRKPLIPARAVLMLDLLSWLWGHGAHFEELARTLAYRLSPEQFVALGIRRDNAAPGVWYDRAWRAKHRLTRLLDPYHATQKRKRLSSDEFAEAQAAYDKERDTRLYTIAQALVRASVGMMPARYHERYRHDVALDSTLVEILGRAETNPRSGARRNVDFTAGTYNHAHRDDTSSERPKPGFELDTVTMVDAKRQIDLDAGRKPAFFPQLITGIAFHRPGMITRGPLKAMQQHSRTFRKAGVCIADRAFNNLQPDSFQLPIRRLGWETVFDYRKNQVGHQASVEGKPIIMVDGQLYVHYMPERLRHITRWHANDEKDPSTGRVPTSEERAAAITAREPYRLKPHGRGADKDGYQRFTYPDPHSYMAFDPATGKHVRRPSLTGSVTIPPQADIVKHLQRHPWGSEAWVKTYGQRNHVESSNKHLKDGRFTDLGDPKKRAGRGYAFQFLASSMAVVASNIRRIVTALRREAREATTPKTRKPRRQLAPVRTAVVDPIDAVGTRGAPPG
ncbi:hypothetical protein [Microbacterium marinilacus]|uniref:Transposase n=1 Tax=Microbacterium marinilacus TaxID=415209 RepID=A0ABP7BKI7_9MICO|nr:hypothetical protein [Microbacterium marinilacus]MBY0688417.1 hypothetical protein [Microbacterium marinilacus]